MAFQLASPGNRAYTARPRGYNQAAFDAMVRNPASYAPLLSGYGYDIVSSHASATGDSFTATVAVFRDTSRSRSINYKFGMSMQPAHVVDTHESLGPYGLAPGHAPVWRTDSVVPVSGL